MSPLKPATLAFKKTNNEEAGLWIKYWAELLKIVNMEVN